MVRKQITWLVMAILAIIMLGGCATPKLTQGRYLFVASPGIRNQVEYGGQGILVFDIDAGHKFIKRIPTGGFGKDGRPDNVKGICASAATGLLYVSTPAEMMCIDIVTEKMRWEKTYDKGCDRMSISRDGKIIYCPGFENDVWHIVNAMNGNEIKTLSVPKAGSHNTLLGLDGDKMYLAGLKSKIVSIADMKTNDIIKTLEPFGNNVRPFTVNGKQTRIYVNVDALLGFEVGDLETGKVLARVEVPGFKTGTIKRHGCPSHGIGLTPDERELWVADAHNRRMHIFDNTVMPPKYVESIELGDEPGWITFSTDGAYAYPSTGEVINAKTHQIITMLKDESGRGVQSEKLVEIDFDGGKPVRVGDQFGVGRVP